MLFGLIGFPIGHSFSKKYFTQKFENEGLTQFRYELFPLPDVSELPHLLNNNPDLRGLNVTLPHKQSVMPLLDELDPTASEVGAVNCIKILENGRLRGYNTDVFGFKISLQRFLERGKIALDGSWSALILGTGGSSKAVASALFDLKVPFFFVSRQAHFPQILDYSMLKSLNWQHFRLVVNTTPLGMSPHFDAAPDLPFECLTDQHFVFDLVYNPTETLLLRRAAAANANTQNGLEMLHLQAEKSWKIWRGLE